MAFKLIELIKHWIPWEIEIHPSYGFLLYVQKHAHVQIDTKWRQRMKGDSWLNNIYLHNFLPFTLTRLTSSVMTRNAQIKYNISDLI